VELGEVAEGLKRTTAPVRRHMRTCERCATFRKQLRANNRALAMLYPVGPLLLLKKTLLAHLGTPPPRAAGPPPRAASPPARPAPARRYRSASAPWPPRPSRASPPRRSSPPGGRGPARFAPGGLAQARGRWRRSNPPACTTAALPRREDAAEPDRRRTAAHRRTRNPPHGAALTSPSRRDGRGKASATPEPPPTTPAGERPREHRGARRRHDRAADRHAGHRGGPAAGGTDAAPRRRSRVSQGPVLSGLPTPAAGRADCRRRLPPRRRRRNPNRERPSRRQRRRPRPHAVAVGHPDGHAHPLVDPRAERHLGRPGPSRITSPASSVAPSTSTSERTGPIWRGGKLTTPTTRRPLELLTGVVRDLRRRALRPDLRSEVDRQLPGGLARLGGSPRRRRPGRRAISTFAKSSYSITGPSCRTGTCDTGS